jgi:hypothetical protein
MAPFEVSLLFLGTLSKGKGKGKGKGKRKGKGKGKGEAAEDGMNTRRPSTHQPQSLLSNTFHIDNLGANTHPRT